MSGKGANKGLTYDEQGELPAGWKTRMDPVKNRRCYYNRTTKQTQWHRPKAEGEASRSSTPSSAGANEAVPPRTGTAGSLVLQTGASKKTLPGSVRVLPETGSATAMPTASAASPAAVPQSEAPSEAPADTERDSQGGAERSQVPLAAQTAEEPELPAGWEAVVSTSSGDTYYKHVATGKTTWDRPTAPAPGLSADTGAGKDAAAPLPVPATATGAASPAARPAGPPTAAAPAPKKTKGGQMRAGESQQ